MVRKVSLDDISNISIVPTVDASDLSQFNLRLKKASEWIKSKHCSTYHTRILICAWKIIGRKYILKKMQPLTTTCRMMTWLSMCSPDGSTTPGQRRAHLAYSVAILIADVACFIASLACCWEFISIDFDSAIFAFMIAIGQFGLIYFMIAAILMSHQIDRIFASLSTIYNCSKFNFIHWTSSKTAFIRER